MKKLAPLQEIRSTAIKSCIHDLIMPDPESTLNFHSEIKFWSQSNAYETPEKFVNLKIAKKIEFFKAK
jgi:hypothetical protein